MNMRILSLVLGASAAAAFAPSQRTASPKVSQSISPLPQPSHAEAVSLTQCEAMLQGTELPEKLYIKKEKEVPKVLGGVKIGLRKLVVITGASSGLGLNCAKALAKSGRYFVVMACRDVEKAKEGMLLNSNRWRK